MSAAKDGGPAFPHDFIGHLSTGMSLRDWFAGQALAALIIADGAQYMSKAVNEHAGIAYQQADAMLYAREQQS